MDETHFVLEVLKRGLCDLHEIEICRRIQEERRSEGIEASLADLLVERGFLTRKQIDRLMGRAAPPSVEPPPTAEEAEAGRQESTSEPEQQEDQLEEILQTLRRTDPEPPRMHDPGPESPLSRQIIGKYFGPYKVLEILRAGPTGVWYKAQKEGAERPCMVHVLRLDPEAVRKIKAEAKDRIRLKHPNLVRTTSIGMVDGRPFHAMEFTEAPPLESLLDQRGRPTEKAALGIALQVASALERIHQAGLVHRGIHPTNLRISDDGIVKLVPPLLPGETGPEESRPPEGERGVRSDLYRLGLLLRKLIPNPSKKVSELILRLTAREPSERPETATDVVRAIQALRPEPPKADTFPPIPTASRPKRTARLQDQKARRTRNDFPWVMAGIAAAALLLLSGTLLVILLLHGPEPKAPAPSSPAGGKGETEDDRGWIELRAAVNGLVAVQQFAQAAERIERARGNVDPEKLDSLERHVREKALEALEDLKTAVQRDIQEGDLVRPQKRLIAFRAKVRALPDVAKAVDTELLRLSEVKAQQKLKAEALDVYIRLNEALRAFLDKKQYDRAIRVCEEWIATNDNPYFREKAQRRIREIRELERKARK